MSTHAGRKSIHHLIEEQVRRWEASRKSAREEPGGRSAGGLAVTISRLPGCSSREIAEQVAGRLGFDLFDTEIITQVAESSHLSTTVLRSLDERANSWVAEVIAALTLQEHGDFFAHLSRVLLTLAQHGGTVILGRGAGFLIPPDRCLRVLLVAPLDARIRRYAEKHRLSAEEAERQVVRIESDRRAYVRKYFHVELLDPTRFDLVLNPTHLSIEGIVTTIMAAWEDKGAALAARSHGAT